jgi:alginate O-acetyltransferase complex protein AlgJ
MSETVNTKLTRRQHITREEEADRCLNHTVYSHGSQYISVLIFLLIVFGVPVAQHVVEIRQNLAKQAAWSPSSGQPKPGLAPQIYDVFGLLPTAEQIRQAKGFWGYWNLIPSVESISAFESSLKENSVLTTTLLSPTQLVMSEFLGAGNEKAYVGRDGWLFYRPDVEYLTTPGFLEPSRLRDRSRGATAIQPDPLKAILDFKTQLSARGIELVVMPMSTKPMIQPEMLVGPSAIGMDLQNDSFAQFQSNLESGGVPVLDPTPVLHEMKSESGPQAYLQTDTHWSPEAMHRVATTLGEFLEKHCGLVPASNDAFTLQPTSISNLGDIAEMLKLPEGQKLFPKQTITIQKVIGKDGTPWKADRSSDVLLLGDSFSNIYSLDGMGWGESAGFAEHLSYAIGRPIDKIVINAGGAFASRQELARQLAHGIDRLANKKVVVYEFSMRDLAQGDWKIIKLPQPPKLRTAPVTPTPVVPITPSKPLTAFKAFTVKPTTIDRSKHEKFQFSIPVPPGNWEMSIVGTDGKNVRKLTGGGATVDTILKGSWDGTNVYGKPVPVGEYAVRIEGTRPDHSALDPVTYPIAVFDGKTAPPVITPLPNPGRNTGPTSPTHPPAGPGPTKPPGTTPPAIHPEQGMTVTGRIAARPATPKPGSVPYKDCVIALQLTDLKVSGGTVKGPNIVVYVWGMKDNKLVDGAYSVGQTIRFKLMPWSAVESKYGGYNRQELDSDEAISWDAYWGEIK